MRIQILLFLLFAFYFQSQAQTPSTSDTTNRPVQVPYEGDEIYTYATEMPKFRGSGDDSLARYVQDHLIYPLDAMEKGITGTVYVQYTIAKDGSVTDVKILPGKGVYPSLDQAAMDVIRNSTGWTPGKNNGVPVAVKKIARIKFTLNKE